MEVPHESVARARELFSSFFSSFLALIGGNDLVVLPLATDAMRRLNDKRAQSQVHKSSNKSNLSNPSVYYPLFASVFIFVTFTSTFVLISCVGVV